LYTGKDFVIIDFEGEPARPLTERRIKRSPWRDVAGMVRSFHYAASAALKGHAPVLVRTEDLSVLEPWANLWYTAVASTFIRSYLQNIEGTNLFVRERQQLRALFYAYLLEKAVYEIGYELNHRPGWLNIPLLGVMQLVDLD
jgi:maltose alpha-D-glucosyltransferase/alpha-amylase